MAWSNSKPQQHSTLRQLLPLVIALVLIGAAGWVGYQIYLSVSQIQKSASERMGNKNVVFTKDGVKVGVKQVENEKYVDKTQGWVVKAWNLGNAKNDASNEDLKKKKRW